MRRTIHFVLFDYSMCRYFHASLCFVCEMLVLYLPTQHVDSFSHLGNKVGMLLRWSMRERWKQGIVAGGTIVQCAASFDHRRCCYRCYFHALAKNSSTVKTRYWVFPFPPSGPWSQPQWEPSACRAGQQDSHDAQQFGPWNRPARHSFCHSLLSSHSFRPSAVSVILVSLVQATAVLVLWMITSLNTLNSEKMVFHACMPPEKLLRRNKSRRVFGTHQLPVACCFRAKINIILRIHTIEGLTQT